MTSTSPDPPSPTRRQRGRASAVREIKAAALEELRLHGAGGVTMRGVARAIEMTPSGLYRYFEDHGALLAALCVDAYDSLSTALESVVAALPDDRASQWFQGSLVLRRWALEHDAEYSLVVGPRLAGVDARHPGLARAAGRLLSLPVGTVANAMDSGELVPVPASLGTARVTSEEVEPRALAIGAGAALVGAVSLEAFGHLPDLGGDRGDFYRTYVLQVMSAMGFTCEPGLTELVIPTP